ncbi:MAG TPA: hypothetical protein VMZ73_09010 [Acidimicrobiales bacterium]|nr:hypothetical protein [Acidimicrobiales bacterium]
MASAIGPARQALWQTLLGVAWPDDLQLAFLAPDVPKLFGVYLLGVSDPTEALVLLGPEAAKEERFGIELTVKWQDPAAREDQAPDVDALAWGVAGQIRDAVLANPTLRLPGETTGTVAWAFLSSQRSPGTGHPAVTEQNQHASGLLCVIEMTVACHARAR